MSLILAMFALAASAGDARQRDEADHALIAKQYSLCLDRGLVNAAEHSDSVALAKAAYAACATTETRLLAAEHRLWRYGIPEFTGPEPIKARALDRATRLVAGGKAGKPGC